MIVNWNNTSETVRAELTDPDGNVILDGIAGNAVEGATTIIVYRMDELHQGTWTLSLSASSGVAQYFTTLSARNVDGVEAQLYFQGDRTPRNQDIGVNRFLRGLPMPIQVVLVDDSGPVANARVTAYINLPDGSTDVMGLYDDGRHGDGQKDDGLYGVVFRRTIFASNSDDQSSSESASTTTPGGYSVTVQVEGESNDGVKFQRELLGGFHVYEYSIKYYANFHVDDDNDGMPDRWEKLWGLNTTKDDTADDNDDDGLNNFDEYNLGTIPSDVDTDNGGEGDGSEVKRTANPNDHSDDLLPRPSDVSILKEIIDDETLPAPRSSEIGIHYPFSRFYQSVVIERSTAPDGPFNPLIEIAEEDATVAYYDASATLGTTYYYRVIGVGDGGATSAPSSVIAGVARKDATPPQGMFGINNGARYTDSLKVNLRIDSSSDTIEMRVSNSSNFRGALWRPFRTKISAYTIAPKTWNNLAVVFVQLRDSAGNLSTIWTDAVIFDPSGDFDGDGVINAIDTDDDGDGLLDLFELNASLTNPFGADSDSDGTDDGDEDPDADGLINLNEQTNGTHPLKPDTDGDGFDDGDEINQGTNPLDARIYPGSEPLPTATPTPTPSGGGLPTLPFTFKHLKTYANLIDNVTGIPNPKELLLSSDGRFIYVSSEDEDGVAVFKRDPDSGLLEFSNTNGDPDRPLLPSVSVDSPDGKYVYAIDEKGVLLVFERNAKTGELKKLFSSSPFLDVVESLPFKMALSPDGAFLYVAQVGRERIIALKKDEPTGEMTFVKMFRVGGKDPSNPPTIQDLKSSSDGSVLLALTAGDRGLILFNRNLDSGNLVVSDHVDLNQRPNIGAAEFDEISLDRQQDRISLLSSKSGIVALLKRDNVKGVLVLDSVTQLDELSDARETVWDDDNQFLFSLHPDGIGISLADDLNGTLNYLVKLGSDDLGVDLVGLTTFKQSEDGRYLYVASSGSDNLPPSLHVFEIIRQTDTGLPDLTPQQFSLVGRNQLESDEEFGGHLTLIASNIGETVSSSFHVGLYLSTDVEITIEDELLVGGREFESGLAAGSSTEVVITSLLAIPDNIEPGYYFIGALLDESGVNVESNEDNNTAVIPIEIIQSLPDLKPTLFSIDGGHLLEVGETIGDRISIEVANIGDADSESFNIGIYISEDSNVTTDDRLLIGGRESEGALAAGDSRQVDVASIMQIPTDLDPGYYFIGVVVDELNGNEESNEANNTAVICLGLEVRMPDLSIAEFRTLGGFTFAPGQEIGERIHALMRNQGDANASGSFYIDFYLSDDAEITREDQLLLGGREHDDDLDLGDTRTVTVTRQAAIPEDAAAGWQYMGIVLDAGDDVVESNESNNTKAIPVLIVSGDPPDALPEPTFTPTPSPLPTTPPVNQPTPTPLPTATPQPEQEPQPVRIFDFSGATFEESGLTAIPGGFSTSNLAGEIEIGDIPIETGSPATDGRGALLRCDPGEVAMLLANAVQVGNRPVIITMAVHATSPEGQVALAALEGTLDGSINALIPADTSHLTNGYKRISILYEPIKADTINIVLQLFTPTTASGPVSVYIDNVRVIPLQAGVKVDPDMLKIDRIRSN